MNVKNLVLGIGIVIVFALVLWQGVEAFYPSPQYNDFCTGNEFGVMTKPLPNGQYPVCNFSKSLQEQQDRCYVEEGQPIFNYDDNGCAVSVKECDMCNKQFNDAQKAHAQVVFFIALIVGIIALITGYAILSVEPVGSALIGSGIWSFFYGTVINWRNFTTVWRFLFLLIALILLIWIAVRLNTQKKKSFWQKMGLRK
jgi:uncharacterized membrane protein